MAIERLDKNHFYFYFFQFRGTFPDFQFQNVRYLIEERSFLDERVQICSLFSMYFPYLG